MKSVKSALVPKYTLPLAALALAVLAGCGGSGGGAGNSGPAVETVNGEAVPQKWLDAFAESRGVDQTKPALRDKALKQLTEMVLLSQAAQKAGLDKDPDFAAAVEVGRLQGTSAAALRAFQKDTQVDDAALRAEYDQQNAKGGPMEYEFGQIVFATQEQAAKAITDIGDKPFDQAIETYKKDARMARVFSHVRSQQLPPPMATALNSLKPGETTKAPIALPQGFAVMHLTSASTVPQPPFEQVKESLRRTLTKRLADERLAKLTSDAKIVVTDPPPTPAVPLNPPPTAPVRMPPQGPGMAPGMAPGQGPMQPRLQPQPPLLQPQPQPQPQPPAKPAAK
jgi:peptidyl-prolyl cis-trans isomerase C